MTHDKIVDQVIKLLRSQDKHGGHFHQEPYKGDFFRLFVLANERGPGLKADRLHSLVAQRAPELLEGKNWHLLYAAWPEWDYAWSRASRGTPLNDDLPGG
jgi:hypothetical protein